MKNPRWTRARVSEAYRDCSPDRFIFVSPTPHVNAFPWPLVGWARGVRRGPTNQVPADSSRSRWLSSACCETNLEFLP